MSSEFSLTIFAKFSNIGFHENPVGSELFPCGRTEGQTDRRDEANSRLAQF
jgi:hypothetical protein